MTSSPLELPTATADAPTLVSAVRAGESVSAVRAGEMGARATLYRRFAPEVARVLAAVLGPDAELADLLQETFVEAFASVDQLRRDDAIGPWLRQIAVHRARRCIRRRRRFRLFQTLGLVDASEPEAPVPSPEVREAIVETYRVLEALPVDLRVAFTLRYVEGLDLVDVASACSVSLATTKRRLKMAEERFRRLAEQGGKLTDWIERRSPR